MKDKTQRSFERLILVSNNASDKAFWQRALDLYNCQYDRFPLTDEQRRTSFRATFYARPNNVRS